MSESAPAFVIRLIGKRHLATTLQHFRRLRPGVKVNIAWQSHEFLPDTSLEGLTYQDFYRRRLDGPAEVMQAAVQVMAPAEPAASPELGP